MHNSLRIIERLIFSWPRSLFITTLCFLAFIKIGIWYIPNLELSQSLSLNPFSNPFSDPNAHYLFWNWLSPFFAWLLGIKTWFKFFILHLVFSIAFTLTFLWYAYRTLPKNEAAKSALLFFILPVSGTAYFWVGPDALTLLLLTIAVVLEKKIYLVIPLGVMLGMQHFEQSLVAATALLSSLLISRSFKTDSIVSLKFCIYLAIGIICGKLALLGIVNKWSITVNSGRLVWLQDHYWLVIKEFIFNFQTILWSVLGLGWIAVLKFSVTEKGSSALFIPLLGLLLLLPFVQDQTRVLSIISYPLLLNFILLNKKFLSEISTKEASGLFLLWALLPWGWVFAGRVQGSVLSYDIVNLLHIKLGWFTLPEIRDYWPFYW